MKKLEENDSIFISNAKWHNCRNFNSKSHFFCAGERYIIKINDECIIITRPDIDYRGKTYKASRKRVHENWVSFQLIANLPLGKFEFDPIESNIDRIVIYYK